MSLVPTNVCEQGLAACLKYIWPDRDPVILEKIAALWERDENWEIIQFAEKHYKRLCSTS